MSALAHFLFRYKAYAALDLVLVKRLLEAVALKPWAVRYSQRTSEHFAIQQTLMIYIEGKEKLSSGDLHALHLPSICDNLKPSDDGWTH